MATRYRAGDRVVFTRDKYTSSPSPRAKNVIAAPNGESYHYQVDKYWVVVEVRAGGELLVATRRGKTHVMQSSHPQLRKASLFERLFRANRFPRAAAAPTAAVKAQPNRPLKTLGSTN